MISIVPLGPGDGPRFRQFSCWNRRQPWTERIEYTIQNDLADNLQLDPSLRAIGIDIESDLGALAVWTPRPDDLSVWEVPLLAVAPGHRGRGCGRSLKAEIVRRARSEGIAAVISFVHRDNDAMLAINAALGGQTTLDPDDALGETLICVIEIF